MTRTSTGVVVNVSGLREAQLAWRVQLRPAGEWLLASAFRASCYVMRAAAQFCGILTGDDAVRAVPAPELQALFLSVLPLAEIAAAERERIWRVEAAASEVLSSDR